MKKTTNQKICEDQHNKKLTKQAIFTVLFLATIISCISSPVTAQQNDTDLHRFYDEIATLLKDGKIDDAQSRLEDHLVSHRSDYVAMTELGTIYQSKGNRNAALRLLTDAEKIAPDYPIVHLRLGKIYFIMQNSEDAILELCTFKEKMRLIPELNDDAKKIYKDGLYFLAEVYHTLKQYEEFRAQTEEILKLFPDEQDAHYNLALYYYSYEHNRSKAYTLLKKTIELAPDTHTGKKAQYAIEYMRHNPDSRIAPDFSFINGEE